MADKFLTLLDLAKFNGSDEAIGVIDEVNTYSPELNSLMGRPINGTTFKFTKKVSNPAGPAFRNVNEGSDLIAASYKQEIGQCFFMDAQMQVDEAIVKGQLSEGGSLGGVLAREAAAVIQQKAINIGSQFYNGVSADAKGFQGLVSNYDATSCLVKAGGTTANVQTSVWLVWNNVQGVHWVFGNNTSIEVDEWRKQTVKDSNSKSFTAWVNNASGFMGLGFGHSKCAVRIANCEDATNKRLHDLLVSEALTKMPLFMQMGGGLKLFMNQQARLQLQKSRSIVNASGSAAGTLITAPTPTESLGIPIVVTDSITNTEAVVA